MNFSSTFSPVLLRSQTFVSRCLPASKLAPWFQRTCLSLSPHRPQTEKMTQSLIALWAEIPRRSSTFQKRKSSQATWGFYFPGNIGMPLFCFFVFLSTHHGLCFILLPVNTGLKCVGADVCFHVMCSSIGYVSSDQLTAANTWLRLAKTIFSPNNWQCEGFSEVFYTKEAKQGTNCKVRCVFNLFKCWAGFVLSFEYFAFQVWLSCSSSKRLNYITSEIHMLSVEQIIDPAKCRCSQR